MVPFRAETTIVTALPQYSTLTGWAMGMTNRAPFTGSRGWGWHHGR